ncbi:MAG TPA: glycosyltransferase family 4 protein, partial [Puia sp.]|nr:glycosyltransferase family 4 protein [Puia sp.]
RVFVNNCLYIGTENRKFFEYYGVSSKRLVYTPYAVDNDYFSLRARELKECSRDIKNKLGLPDDKKIILFSGKYIPKKNPLDLLKAFHLLNDDRFALVMVGEGELRKQMEQFIAENNLRQVWLTGFVNQSEIPSYYSIADVFVMCSGMGETWGLSVNEAMNFGKPVIVSDTTGCSIDLVKQGLNGYVFSEGDISSLAGYIREVLENDAFRVNAGQKSAEIIQQYSIEIVSENIKKQLAEINN